MDLKRAVNAWRDRRAVQKYSDAAHVMNHAEHQEAFLKDMQGTTAAEGYRDLAKGLDKTSGKTAKRIDHLAGNPDLRAKVDKGLGLQGPHENSNVNPWA